MTDPRGTDDNPFRKRALVRWQWLNADGKWCRFDLSWCKNIRFWLRKEQAVQYPPKDGVKLVKIIKRWVNKENEAAYARAVLRASKEAGY